MNKIILTGHLGQSASVRDVDKRDNSGTTTVVNFSLAVKVGWGQHEQTRWYGCSWWGERAAQWLTKGKQVMVEGEPDVRLFNKRDGSPSGEIAVTVRELEFLGGGKESGGDSAPAAPAAAAAGKPEEDVPF